MNWSRFRLKPGRILLFCFFAAASIWIFTNLRARTLSATALTEKIPELPDGWFYLAYAYARLNKIADAAAALKKCFVAATHKDEEEKWQDRALATRDLDGFWCSNPREK